MTETIFYAVIPQKFDAPNLASAQQHAAKIFGPPGFSNLRRLESGQWCADPAPYRPPVAPTPARVATSAPTPRQDLSALADTISAKHAAKSNVVEFPRTNDAAPQGPSPNRVLDSADIASRPRIKWLVRGILPCAAEGGGLGLIFGPTQSGKSFLAFDLIAAVTRGLPQWCGRHVAKGTAVYICAEGQGGAVGRVQAYAKHTGAALADLPGIVPHSPDLLDPAAQADVLAELRAYKARKGGLAVVLIDTKSAVTPGADENGSEAAGALIAFCKRVTRETGAFCLLVDHTGVGDQDRPRGHTSLLAAADMALQVTRRDDAREWTVRKMKDGRDADRAAFRLDVVNLGVDEYGEAETSCVVAHLDGLAAPPSSNTPAQDAVLATLRDLAGDVTPDALIVATASADPAGNTAASRKRARNAIEKLTNKNRLKVTGGFVRAVGVRECSKEDFEG